MIQGDNESKEKANEVVNNVEEESPVKVTMRSSVCTPSEVSGLPSADADYLYSVVCKNKEVTTPSTDR